MEGAEPKEGGENYGIEGFTNYSLHVILSG
jgi:hypothetical protein